MTNQPRRIRHGPFRADQLRDGDRYELSNSDAGAIQPGSSARCGVAQFFAMPGLRQPALTLERLSKNCSLKIKLLWCRSPLAGDFGELSSASRLLQSTT